MRYRRVLAERPGAPDVLKVVEEEVPEPRPGEIRIRVEAAGVAFGDVMRRSGLQPGQRFPFTPGYDVVGTVDALGAGVSGLAVGDRVAALVVTGGYAEYACTPAARACPVPQELDPVTSVSVVLNYLTAFQMLHRAARMKQGERILVHGAAGGVGTALLQLGGLAGVERYGTASAGKHEIVRALGGIPIDYRHEDFVARIRELTGDGVDAVFDAIGGTHLLRSHRALRRGGRLVAYGLSAALRGGRSQLFLTLGILLALKAVPDGRRATLSGVSPGARTYREDLSALLTLAAGKKIAPIVAERMPLDAAARAHELLERGAVEGKLVLVPERRS